jgi:hypothetical protein
VDLVDRPGQESRYVRSSDVGRAEFSTHPMTLGVGRDLRRTLEQQLPNIRTSARDLGVVAISAEDDVYVRPKSAWRGSESMPLRGLVTGDLVRDWCVDTDDVALFPYTHAVLLATAAELERDLWAFRTVLWNRQTFGRRTYRDEGRTWWEWHQTTLDRLTTPLTITWGEVATHNHFVLDRGGKVFNRTAPVIKLPESASEDDHLRLLGVLNSSTACFWLKQVCSGKGGSGMGRGLQDEAWEERYALNASNVADLPLPPSRPLDLPKRLDALARDRAALLAELPEHNLRGAVARLRDRDGVLFAEQVALQEELDWQVIASFNLVPHDLPLAGLDAPPLRLGERAFEIVLARQFARGDVETTWFARHDSTPITDLPSHWPADYRAIVERRIELIENDPNVGLIERPEHKRRWTGQRPFDERLHEALTDLVLDRLEDRDLWSEPRLRSVSELADLVRRDARLVEACQLIAGSPDADVGDVVGKLVLNEAVPFLAAWRHTEAGLRKRSRWERVWDLQRAEDAVDALAALPEDDSRRLTEAQAEERKAREVGRIDVPPRYAQSDFRPGPGWRLRGKLDVPKERFVLVPGAERGAANAPVVGWAGWDELERARALAARVLELRDAEAADAERLTPLLAGVLELLPWIAQWHPDHDPLYGMSPGAFFDTWLDGTLAEHGLTRDALRAWRPPAPTRRGRRRALTATTS